LAIDTSDIPTLENLVGGTPLIRLQRMLKNPSSLVCAKLEGNNPAGSVKDRPALSMIRRAEERGDIQPGDTLIEATSGNTGIALAMVAAMRGYKMILIMPENATEERKASMFAYGAELIEVSKEASMEGARDLALKMQSQGEGKVLDQFGNNDNPRTHYETTGPEIWRQTSGQITHFVSSMGTTGTIMGVSQFLKEKNTDIQIVGLQPADDARIPGIRKWPEAYQPSIFSPSRVDQVVEMAQELAEVTARKLARQEGICAGVSSGGAIAAALDIAEAQDNALVVALVCDRGDRYLSSGVFNN
jgi:cysteine synthase B